MKGFRSSTGGVRRLALLLVLLPAAWNRAPAAMIDRIAALVDRQVITVSEVNQMAAIRFFPRPAGQTDDDYHHAILESLIAQALRYRDVERFGTETIADGSIDERLKQIEGRFASPAEFAPAVQRAELTVDEVRTLIKRQLQVESYIQERFAPMIFVSSEEIENEYRGPWSEQRRGRGLPIPPLADAQDEIRRQLRGTRLQQEVDRWTGQLRSRSNVDIYAWR